MATTLDEVIEAWQFVYEVYRRIGAIHPNPWCLHTVPQAVHNDSVVILGRNGSRLVNTMTVHFDRELGLSLDSIYKSKLNELRGQDRELIEVGLFADRRDFGIRSIKPLMEVMRLAWHYGIGNGATDGIIGVRPLHARFYARWLGFDVFGPKCHYPLVNHSTVLLRLDWRKALQRLPMPRGYPTILSNPLEPDYFDDRFRLDEQSIAGSPIADFLEYSASQG